MSPDPALSVADHGLAAHTDRHTGILEVHNKRDVRIGSHDHARRIWRVTQDERGCEAMDDYDDVASGRAHLFSAQQVHEACNFLKAQVNWSGELAAPMILNKTR